MNEFTRRLNVFLAARDIPPKMLAQFTGLAVSSVRDLLTGRRLPHFSTLQKIIETFPDLDARKLICGGGEEKKKPKDKISEFMVPRPGGY